MKTKYLILLVALGCLAFACCDWDPGSCADEAAINYGRPQRVPILFNTEYISMYDFNKQYMQIVEGDTLRLMGYLVHGGTDEIGYAISLCSSPEAVYNKSTYHDYPAAGAEFIRIKANGSYRRGTPYIPEDCYDTLKYKLCKIEGLIQFNHLESSEVSCIEFSYLNVGDWDECFNRIIDQQTNQQRQKEQ